MADTILKSEARIKNFVSKEMDKIRKDVKSATTQMKNDFGSVDKGVQKLTSTVKKFKTTGIGVLVAAVVAAGVAIVGLGKKLTDLNLEVQGLQNRMQASVGEFANYQVEIQRLREESDRMGLSFVGTAKSFSSFAAAATRSGITMQETRDIYRNIAETAVSLRLSNDATGRAFTALQQIASKGVVSMEELRQQLSESIPGALGIAAKSMGVTQQRFNEMVSSGELLATDFLPKFAEAVREELGGSFESSTTQMQANINRLKNSFFTLGSFVARKAAPLINSFVENATNVLDKVINKVGATTDIDELINDQTEALIRQRKELQSTIDAFNRSQEAAKKGQLVVKIVDKNEMELAKDQIKSVNKELAILANDQVVALQQQKRELEDVVKFASGAGADPTKILLNPESLDEAKQKLSEVSTEILKFQSIVQGAGGVPETERPVIVDKKALKEQEKLAKKRAKDQKKAAEDFVSMWKKGLEDVKKERIRVEEEIQDSEFALRTERAMAIENDLEKELELLRIEHDKRIAELGENHRAIENMEKVHSLELQRVADEHRAMEEQKDAENFKNRMAMIGDFAAQSINTLASSVGQGGDAFKRGLKQVLNQFLDFVIVKKIAAEAAIFAGDVAKLGFAGFGTAAAKVAGLTTLLVGAKAAVNSFQRGTANAPGGLARVGEFGPEVISGPANGFVPRGSQVFNTQETKEIFGGNNVTLVINGNNSAEVEDAGEILVSQIRDLARDRKFDDVISEIVQRS
jgi:tape measure domain-containing protein